MKKAFDIISHLSSSPQFRLLKQHSCYKRYISALGDKWQKAIAFVYIKNDTLFVAVKHPAFKQELNYNKDLLMSILKDFNRYVVECNMMSANQVVIFHSKYHAMPTGETYKSVPHYAEHSKGEFESPSDDELYEKFEKIKKIIKCSTQ